MIENAFMTRTGINDALWAVGLGLQVVLAGVVFARRVARELPVFTGLIVFYPLRSAWLFFSARHIPPDDYASMYGVLAVFSVVLQTAVAGELVVHLWRERGYAVLWIVGLGVLGWGAALGIAGVLPVTQLPVDRLQMGVSVGMVGVGVAALWRRRLRSVAVGLGAFGVVDVAATVGKTMAAARRDAGSFAAWSYASSTAWLAVVVFWIVALRGGVTCGDGGEGSRS